MRLPLCQGTYYQSDIHDADGARVAETLPWNTPAGAERGARIVAMLNSHGDLDAALRWIVHVWCGVGKDGGPPSPAEYVAALEAGKAALRKARGGDEV